MQVNYSSWWILKISSIMFVREVYEMHLILWPHLFIICPLYLFCSFFFPTEDASFSSNTEILTKMNNCDHFWKPTWNILELYYLLMLFFPEGKLHQLKSWSDMHGIYIINSATTLGCSWTNLIPSVNIRQRGNDESLTSSTELMLKY